MGACAAQYVTAGANPISVKKGIDKTCDFLVEKLREKAQPVKGSSDIKARCCGRRRTGSCCAALWCQAEGLNAFGTWRCPHAPFQGRKRS